MIDIVREEKLKTWLSHQIEHATVLGEDLFLGVPDSWYEQGLHCCNSGHVFTSYLKSEALGRCVCFKCLQPSHIFPTGFGEAEFMTIMSLKTY